MGGEWLAGLGEGIKNAVSTYRDVRRDNDENAQRAEDRKLRAQALAFDLAEKGYQYDPVSGSVVRTSGALDQDRYKREQEAYQNDVRLLQAMDESERASPAGRRFAAGLLNKRRSFGQPPQQQKENGGGGLIPEQNRGGLVPVGLVEDAPVTEADLSPPPGFQTKEQKREAARIAAEERAEARRRDRERRGEDSKPPGAGQAAAATYARRLELAEDTFNHLAGQGFNLASLKNQYARKASGLPLIGDAVRSQVDPRVLAQDQAERNFINAVLRRESGAAIAPSEFTSAEKQYFERPGDDAAMRAQKAANRKAVLAGLRSEAGNAYGKLRKQEGMLGGGGGAPKPKTVKQNGHTYTLNEQTGEYE